MFLDKLSDLQQISSKASLIFHEAMADTTAVINSIRFSFTSIFLGVSSTTCWSPVISRGSSLSGLNVRMSGTTASKYDDDMEALSIGWIVVSMCVGSWDNNEARV